MTRKRETLIVCLAQRDADKGNMPSIIQTTHRKSNRVVFSTVLQSHNRKEKANPGLDEMLCALLMPFMSAAFHNYFILT